MSFEWKKYLELARLLASEPPNGCSEEAAKRSAVSRAYYAVFCHIRNYAKSNWGFQPENTAKDHKSLREFLRKNGETELASSLNKLREWRNMCDYDNSVTNLDDLVKNALALAHRIIKKYT